MGSWSGLDVAWRADAPEISANVSARVRVRVGVRVKVLHRLLETGLTLVRYALIFWGIFPAWADHFKVRARVGLGLG